VTCLVRPTAKRHLCPKTEVIFLVSCRNHHATKFEELNTVCGESIEIEDLIIVDLEILGEIWAARDLLTHGCGLL